MHGPDENDDVAGINELIELDTSSDEDIEDD